MDRGEDFFFMFHDPILACEDLGYVGVLPSHVCLYKRRSLRNLLANISDCEFVKFISKKDKIGRQKQRANDQDQEYQIEFSGMPH